MRRILIGITAALLSLPVLAQAANLGNARWNLAVRVSSDTHLSPTIVEHVLDSLVTTNAYDWEPADTSKVSQMLWGREGFVDGPQDPKLLSHRGGSIRYAELDGEGYLYVVRWKSLQPDLKEFIRKGGHYDFWRVSCYHESYRRGLALRVAADPLRTPPQINATLDSLCLARPLVVDAGEREQKLCALNGHDALGSGPAPLSSHKRVDGLYDIYAFQRDYDAGLTIISSWVSQSAFPWIAKNGECDQQFFTRLVKAHDPTLRTWFIRS